MKVTLTISPLRINQRLRKLNADGIQNQKVIIYVLFVVTECIINIFTNMFLYSI